MKTLIHKYSTAIIIIILLLSPKTSKAWGQNGHRTIGQIAENHLSAIAKANISRLLDGESIAEASTWMDEIRSDSTYDYMQDWHWVTIPDSSTYDLTTKNSNGDIIFTIERIIKELSSNKALSNNQERNMVKILIHLIGDIHQPMHVGTGKDRGGNDLKITWFWNKETNLHRVWDFEMIDSKKLSYTELADFCDHSTFRDRQNWQSQGVRVWARESKELRDQVYDIPEDKMLSYQYVYKQWPTVKTRLLQAGIRLANILNKIYG